MSISLPVLTMHEREINDVLRAVSAWAKYIMDTPREVRGFMTDEELALLEAHAALLQAREETRARIAHDLPLLQELIAKRMEEMR
jgi:hypothetical protein